MNDVLAVLCVHTSRHVVLSQTPNSMYEEAQKMQKKANKEYMLALGLANSPPIKMKTSKVPDTNTKDPDPDYKPEEDSDDSDNEPKKAPPSAMKRLFDTDEDSPVKKTAKKSDKQAAEESVKKASASSDKQAAKKSSASTSKKASASTKWCRCRKPILSSQQFETLQLCFKAAPPKIKSRFDQAKTFEFVERVTREYISRWKKTGDDLHLDREKILKRSINAVRIEQVRPTEFIADDVDHTCKCCLPLLEQTLEMPGSEIDKVGTRKWIMEKIRIKDFAFEFLHDHPELMDAYIKTMISQGHHKTGFPVVGPDETVPQGKVYDVKKGPRKRKRRNKQPDKWFPFLRDGAVKAAIQEMKDRNIYPQNVRPQDMPGKQGGFNNFTLVRAFNQLYMTS